jgi:Domain of unknown function (DUF4397)
MFRWKNPLASLIRRTFLMVSLFTLLCTFVGVEVRPVAAAGPWAFVRVIHASPDAGTVDLFVDGKKLLSNFQFATITGYTQVAVGAHKVQIAVIGTGVNAAVLSETLTFEPNMSYTVAGLGTKQTGFSFQTFIDDNSIVGNNVAKVRVYHLSPGSGTVNVATNGKTIVDGLPYDHASDYTTFSAGSYTFNVTLAQNNTTLPVTEQLTPGTVTSIFTIGMLNGNPKIQFLNAQVAGTPGMPGTGSDPNALPANANTPSSSPSWVWLWATLAMLLSGIGVTMGLWKKSSGVR